MKLNNLVDVIPPILLIETSAEIIATASCNKGIEAVKNLHHRSES